MNAEALVVLKFLNQFPIGTKANISDILNEIFKFDNSISEYEYLKWHGNITRFLDELKKEKYIQFEDNSLTIAVYRDNPQKWFNYPFNAYITNAGTEALKREEERLINERVNLSHVDTNASIIATNKSVQNTNRAIVDNSKEQSSINKAIENNSERQTEILRSQAAILNKQTIIFLSTAIFALFSVFISGTTLFLEFQKREISLQLQQAQKEISELKHRILESSRSANPKIIDQKKNP